jgi:hypothetical protein
LSRISRHLPAMQVSVFQLDVSALTTLTKC